MEASGSSSDGNVSWSTTLVQTEISQHLWMTFCTDMFCIVPRG